MLVLELQSKSLALTRRCTSQEILHCLWNEYYSGLLKGMAQKYLVTEQVVKEFDLTGLKLTTTTQEENYITA